MTNPHWPSHLSHCDSTPCLSEHNNSERQSSIRPHWHKGLGSVAALALIAGIPAAATPRFMTVSHYGELPAHQQWNPLQDGSDFRPFEDFVAAHRSLPIGTRLLLTHAENPRRSIVVTVLDRGPFVQGRDLDISTAAAQALGIYEEGVTEVEVTPLD